MSHAETYLAQAAEICRTLDPAEIEAMAAALVALRNRGGRLFILGVGGSAANCGHAVNDFRKLCGIEAYAPTDNVAELTARTNDEGWESVFAGWLAVSKAGADDAVLVLSVGGGSRERNVSPNLVLALEYAKQNGLTVLGIVGRDGGYTKQVGDHVIVVPVVDANHITPHSEAFQAVIWHGLVCHPDLMANANKWEGLSGTKA
ncbi:MAG: SIS domain-containing protein [Alphaproteobacteria bacterium]|nr:SIS domain-containing protein [Alphaproteobacteria bacterium]